MESAVDKFEGFAIFQPIINGIGGNLVSVQASKISTMLHQTATMGVLPPHGKIFEWPWKALFKGGLYYSTTISIQILILLTFFSSVRKNC